MTTQKPSLAHLQTVGEFKDKDEIVCLCYDLTVEDIIGYFEKGYLSLDTIRKNTKAATRCDGCAVDIDDLLDAYLQKTGGKATVEKSPLLESLKKKCKNSIKAAIGSFSERKLGSSYVESDDLHTRIFICNMELPQYPEHFRKAKVTIDLYDETGKLIQTSHHLLDKNKTLRFDLQEHIPRKKGELKCGFISVHYRMNMMRSGDRKGTLRYYSHWYNDAGISFTHEKRREGPYKNGNFDFTHGRDTVPLSLCNNDIETWFSLTNCGKESYQSNIILLNDEGERFLTPVSLPPFGTLFKPVTELFPQYNGEQNGMLYPENADHPLLPYYFVKQKKTGRWQVQHL